MLFSNRHTFKSIWFEFTLLARHLSGYAGTPDPGHERFAQAIADGRMSNAEAFRIAFDKPNLRTAVAGASASRLLEMLKFLTA